MLRHWIYSVLEESVNKDEIPDEVWKSLSRISEAISQSSDYCFRTESAANLFDRIQDAAKIQDLSYLIYDVAVHYGFQHGSLFLLQSADSGSIWKHRVCTSLPERWLRHYKEAEYQFVDPAILHSVTLNQPAFIGRLSNDTARVAQFWDDTERHRIGTTVYCGNHRTKSGAFIGFSLLSQNTEKACRKKIRHDASDIFKLTESLASVFEEFSAMGSEYQEKLSQEELLFLRSVLTGKSVGEPISVGGFKVCPKSIQASISKKLGVDTILQAIAIAASRGWFDDALYSEGEVHTIFENLPNIEDFKLITRKDMNVINGKLTIN